MNNTIYVAQHSQFLCQDVEDKTLRQQLKTQGIDARRMSRFTQLALLGTLPLKEHICPNTPIYLASSFSSPAKFNKIFQQLNRENIPSPLDFMANLNNVATFQLAQTLNTTATTLFLAVNQHNYLQPLKLAMLDLQSECCQNALVGWAYESPNGEQEGSIWWLLSQNSLNNISSDVISIDDANNGLNTSHWFTTIQEMNIKNESVFSLLK